MDFNSKIHEVAKRVATLAQSCATEEATKNALILPFIQALGFDPFNPLEVIPEFIADAGNKKGEKVDFAISIGEKVDILIEAKAAHINLKDAQFNQLIRYYTVTDAKFGILTNGIQYNFYTDMDDKNKMDRLPFFQFDILSFDDKDLKELEKFHKSKFNINIILSTAENLKYKRAAKDILLQQIENPTDEFVKLIGKDIYNGNLVSSVVNQLRIPIKYAFEDIVKDSIEKRLKKMETLLETGNEANSHEETEIDEENFDGIVTTEEEISGYHIVRAICAEVVDPNRIYDRDTKSYFGILMDNKNTKPIARLHFNAKSVKYISTFDEEKNETRHKIEKISDIYKFKNVLQKSAESYT